MLVDLRNIQQSCHRVNDNALLPQSRDDVNGTDERPASSFTGEHNPRAGYVRFQHGLTSGKNLCIVHLNRWR